NARPGRVMNSTRAVEVRIQAVLAPSISPPWAARGSASSSAQAGDGFRGNFLSIAGSSRVCVALFWCLVVVFVAELLAVGAVRPIWAAVFASGALPCVVIAILVP